ncbi:MAG TPA: dodecin domain-containing protein [Thermofilaceae archaeon]|nr:dodecin domain-containing protein [Thermofilaceae archaeon]
MPVYKYIELVGVSSKSWEDAVRAVVREAAKTVRNIVRVEVQELIAEVEEGEVREFKARVKLLFMVERPE